jgi:uncharacterized protein YacL
MKPSLKIVVGWAIGSILGYATALLMTYYVQPDSLPTMAVFIPIMAAIVLIAVFLRRQKQPPQSN